MISSLDIEQTICEYLGEGTSCETSIFNENNRTSLKIAVNVTSPAFEGMRLIDRHRKIYAALSLWLENETIHSVEIKKVACP